MNGKTLDKIRKIVDGDPQVAMYMSELYKLTWFEEVVDYMTKKGWSGDDFLGILFGECKGNLLEMAAKIRAIIRKRNTTEKIILGKDWR